VKLVKVKEGGKQKEKITMSNEEGRANNNYLMRKRTVNDAEK
jgi:hypothetical protein